MAALQSNDPLATIGLARPSQNADQAHLGGESVGITLDLAPDAPRELDSVGTGAQTKGVDRRSYIAATAGIAVVTIGISCAGYYFDSEARRERSRMEQTRQSELNVRVASLKPRLMAWSKLDSNTPIESESAYSLATDVSDTFIDGDQSSLRKRFGDRSEAVLIAARAFTTSLNDLSGGDATSNELAELRKSLQMETTRLGELARKNVKVEFVVVRRFSSKGTDGVYEAFKWDGYKKCVLVADPGEVNVGTLEHSFLTVEPLGEQEYSVVKSNAFQSRTDVEYYETFKSNRIEHEVAEVRARVREVEAKISSINQTRTNEMDSASKNSIHYAGQLADLL